jgi:biotin carboxylase
MDVFVTVGSEKANALARPDSTAFLTLSFHDPELAAQQVVEFAHKHPIDAVVAVDDQVTLVGAVVCKALSLRHNTAESVSAAQNKYRMRQLFRQANVPSPDFQLGRFDDGVTPLAAGMSFPSVVKPLSLSGSQGVIRVDNQDEFVAAVGRLKRILDRQNRGATRSNDSETSQMNALPSESSTSFLIEDFISGAEIALEGLVCNGHLHVLALFDKPDPLEGPFFAETIYVTPSQLPSDVQKQIIRCTQRALEALGLIEGPIHAELRIGPDGPVMIEVNSRSIGGQCSRILRFGTGISLEELIIRHALEADFEPPLRETQPGGVMMIPVPQAGKLTEVRGLQDAEAVADIEQVMVSTHVGQRLVPLPEDAMYLGFIFARASSTAAVESALREAYARLDFVIE